MNTRPIAVNRWLLKSKVFAVLASVAVTAGLVVASQPAAAWVPGADNPGYEVGQIVTKEPNHPLWDNIVIGRLYLDRMDWIAGTQLKLTTVMDLSDRSFTPKTCQGPEKEDGTRSIYWAGLRNLRYTFKNIDGPLPDLKIANIENPITTEGRTPRVYGPENAQGVFWSHDFIDGDTVSTGTDPLSSGRYSFTFTAPVGSDVFGPDRLPDLLDVDVSAWQMIKGLPGENTTINDQSACYFSPYFHKLKPGSLQAFGSTKLTATTKSVTWGTKPSVTAKVTSAEGVPTGKVDVTGPHGIKGSGTLVQKGSAGQAVISLPAKLPVGTHKLTVTYAGQGQHSGASSTVNLKVTKRKPSLTVKVTKKPKMKKEGKATLTVASPLSTKPSGKVTVTLKKGKTSKKVTGKLKKGKVTVTLPKLAKGTWTVTGRYAGDYRFAVATRSAPKLKSS